MNEQNKCHAEREGRGGGQSTSHIDVDVDADIGSEEGDLIAHHRDKHLPPPLFRHTE